MSTSCLLALVLAGAPADAPLTVRASFADDLSTQSDLAKNVFLRAPFERLAEFGEPTSIPFTIDAALDEATRSG